MKRTYILLLTICLVFATLSAAAPVAHAAENSTVILFEGREQSGGEIKINVNVRENGGVYSMLLTLDYDRSALTLTDIGYGAAFSSLKPLASGSYDTSPYRISYLGTNKQNDTSVGEMMTLTFKVKENAPDGDYTVKFIYERNKDVTYLKDGELQTKNLVVHGAKITLKNSTVSDIGTVPDDSTETPDKNNGIAIAVAVACVVAAAGVTVAVVLTVRKKKKKWVKV